MAQLELVDCTFASCVTRAPVYVEGGAGLVTTLRVHRCLFSGNSVGAAWRDGKGSAAITLSSMSGPVTATLIDSEFSHNTFDHPVDVSDGGVIK